VNTSPSLCAGEQCRDFNAEPTIGNVLRFARVDSDTVTVSRSDEERTLRVTFDPDRQLIEFSGLYFESKQLRIRVLNGDSEPSVVDEKDSVCELELVADVYIQSLLELEQ
jgi:hypothetical protein